MAENKKVFYYNKSIKSKLKSTSFTVNKDSDETKERKIRLLPKEDMTVLFFLQK